MRKQKQRDFFESSPEHKANRHTHGGSTAHGKRKLMRPFDRKRPVHVVMRSSKAKGSLSMLRADKKLKVEALVRKTAAQQGVTIHQFANVGNHLHIVARSSTKSGFQNFLRLVGGLVARLVTGARKGRPFGKFWDALAFSRVVIGRRAFDDVKAYVFANFIEGRHGGLDRAFFQENRNRKRDQIQSDIYRIIDDDPGVFGDL